MPGAGYERKPSPIVVLIGGGSLRLIGGSLAPTGTLFGTLCEACVFLADVLGARQCVSLVVRRVCSPPPMPAFSGIESARFRMLREGRYAMVCF